MHRALLARFYEENTLGYSKNYSNKLRTPAQSQEYIQQNQLIKESFQPNNEYFQPTNNDFQPTTDNFEPVSAPLEPQTNIETAPPPETNVETAPEPKINPVTQRPFQIEGTSSGKLHCAPGYESYEGSCIKSIFVHGCTLGKTFWDGSKCNPNWPVCGEDQLNDLNTGECVDKNAYSAQQDTDVVQVTALNSLAGAPPSNGPDGETEGERDKRLWYYGVRYFKGTLKFVSTSAWAAEYEHWYKTRVATGLSVPTPLSPDDETYYLDPHGAPLKQGTTTIVWGETPSNQILIDPNEIKKEDDPYMYTYYLELPDYARQYVRMVLGVNEDQLRKLCQDGDVKTNQTLILTKKYVPVLDLFKSLPIGSKIQLFREITSNNDAVVIDMDGYGDFDLFWRLIQLEKVKGEGYINSKYRTVSVPESTPPPAEINTSTTTSQSLTNWGAPATPAAPVSAPGATTSNWESVDYLEYLTFHPIMQEYIRNLMQPKDDQDLRKMFYLDQGKIPIFRAKNDHLLQAQVKTAVETQQKITAQQIQQVNTDSNNEVAWAESQKITPITSNDEQIIPLEKPFEWTPTLLQLAPITPSEPLPTPKELVPPPKTFKQKIIDMIGHGSWEYDETTNRQDIPFFEEMIRLGNFTEDYALRDMIFLLQEQGFI
jgi:hypothetical protein